MKIIAIDPGTFKSAYVVYSTIDKKLDDFGIRENLDIFVALKEAFEKSKTGEHGEVKLVIEMLKSYGMVMGDTCLETCVWIGRFKQAWHKPENVSTIPRKTVVTQICGSAKAKDKNIRQALIDKFGGSKAIGNKKDPGPLYGVSKDVWAALAVAVAWDELNEFNFLK